MMSPSRSEFLRTRGLRHHIRRWGDADKPAIFLGHGFLDVSETFQALVEPLLARWQVLAPDWRGFGYTEWPQQGYWFQDYVADLDAILDHYAPGSESLILVGHSMSAQIMSLYAGLRPAKVAKLVLLDGVALPDMPSSLAPKRFRNWLDQLRQPSHERFYESFDDLAGRVRRQHPRIDEAQARFIARCWGHEDGHGRIRLCADPRHRLNGPQLYHAADSEAIWRQITAETLFIEAGKSELAMPAEARAARLACFGRRRVETLAGAGHMLHFEAPRETAALIADFLSS